MKKQNYLHFMVISFIMLIINFNSHAQIELVKEINPGTIGSNLSSFTDVNGILFFTADDGVNGRELWKSDGTAAGTVLVKDIRSGPNSSSPRSFTTLNGTLFFSVDDWVNGYELWKSDGTEAGTVLVKDIQPGFLGSVSSIFNFNGTLFFSALTLDNGEELWKSDGTAAGTVLVKDINPGSNSSRPEAFTNINGTLFFSAVTDNGKELWKSDGTAAGTVLVKDINPGSSSAFSTNSSFYFVNLNGTLFFTADDGVHGNELWKSDGTTAGTVLVKDIRPSGNTGISYISIANGTLFFNAGDGVNGTELWKSDGTTAGTVLVKDINPGVANGGTLYFIYDINGTSFFTANDGVNGYELWKSDGTEAGTVMVKDIFPGNSGSIPFNFINVNGILYFTANDGVHGKELWKSDGTNAGTEMVEDFNPGSNGNGNASFLIFINNNIYMSYGIPSTNYELYKLPIVDNSLTWTGAVSNQWNVAGNWQPQQIPTTTDNVIIPASASVFPVSSATNVCHDLTIKAGATLTMTGGSLSAYGAVTAPFANCFNLTGGNLKLYEGTIFPSDMVFNNLTIYMNPNSTAPQTNTYDLPGYPTINRDLKILNGSNLLPVVKLSDVASNGMHVYGSITVNGGSFVFDDDLLILNGSLTVSNGGLIGRETDAPIGTLASDLPKIIALGTIATPTISVRNDNTCTTCGQINASLEIEPSIKISNTSLTVYDFILDQTYDLKNKKLRVLGQVLYTLPTSAFVNTGTNFGTLQIFQKFIPDNSTPLEIRANRLRELYLANNSGSPDAIIVNNLTVEKFIASDITANIPSSVTLTIGSTTSGNGLLSTTERIYAAYGNLKLLGSASQLPYDLNFDEINNLTVNSPAGVKLVSNIADQIIHGALTLSSGRLDLNGEYIRINEASGLVKETAGNVIYSSVSPEGAVTIQNNFIAPVNNLNIGGLGFFLSTSNPLNDITIDRSYFQNVGINGHTSIYRTYNIQNDAGGTGLVAKIKLKYDDTELDGINEANLRIFRKTSTEQTWHLLTQNQTVNTAANVVTASGSFPRVDITGNSSPTDWTIYTLGDVNNALRNGITIDGKTEQVVLEENQLLLYPNPAKDHLEIRMKATAKQSTLEIISITGKQKMSKIIMANDSGNYYESIDISNLSSGIYLLKMVNKNGTQTKKFVKQ